MRMRLCQVGVQYTKGVSDIGTHLVNRPVFTLYVMSTRIAESVLQHPSTPAPVRAGAGTGRRETVITDVKGIS